MSVYLSQLRRSMSPEVLRLVQVTALAAPVVVSFILYGIPLVALLIQRGGQAIGGL